MTQRNEKGGKAVSEMEKKERVPLRARESEREKENKVLLISLLSVQSIVLDCTCVFRGTLERKRGRKVE